MFRDFEADVCGIENRNALPWLRMGFGSVKRFLEVSQESVNELRYASCERVQRSRDRGVRREAGGPNSGEKQEE
jgi:hypothetical protein